MTPAKHRAITGMPRYTPTVGPEPWEMTLAQLDRYHDVGPSGTGYDGAPANTKKPPPVGTWRADPILKYVEQLQELPISAVEFTEDINSPTIRGSVAKYVDYYKQGLEPLPGDVVFNGPTQRLVTLNRRRVIAAKIAGRKKFKAWVGGDKYEDVVERAQAAAAVRPAKPPTKITIRYGRVTKA